MANETPLSTPLAGKGLVFSLGVEELVELISNGAVEINVEGCHAIVHQVSAGGKNFILIDTGEAHLAVEVA